MDTTENPDEITIDVDDEEEEDDDDVVGQFIEGFEADQIGHFSHQTGHSSEPALKLF